MYTTFLSWRYLFARLTNLVGIVGILVAVGALILILSIMTGFLEEHRRTVRGSLSDLTIAPIQHATMADGRQVPLEPGPTLRKVRTDPRVVGASARLVWVGMIAQGGEQAGYISRLMTNPDLGGLLGVQLVGIDVRTAENVALVGVAVALRLHGVHWNAPRFGDEFETTDFLSSLAREGNPRQRSAPVRYPLLPFAPVQSLDRSPLPRAPVLVGEQLFDRLDMRRGSVLQLATAVPDPRTGDVRINNREFLVAGTFRSGANEMDLERIYLPRRELSDFLGGTLRYSEILVRLADYDRDARAVRQDFLEVLAREGLIWDGGREEDAVRDRQVRTWEDQKQMLLRAIENERVLMAIMLSLILVVAGFTIFAILTMMVTEKRRDIGILTAVGATPRGILTTFVMIGFWDALLGTALGTLAGVQAALHIDDIEIWLSERFGWQIFDRNVYFFDRIPSVVQPGAVALIVFGAFALTLLFAAIPAWRAARLDPVVALRYE